MKQSIFLTGQHFGSWLVLGESPARGYNRMWLCRCELCGTEKDVYQCALRNGTSKSCVCKNGRKETHGLSQSPEYKIWSCIYTRCFNKRFRAFHRYGGRGITMCDRWRTFTNFLEDMGPRPSPDHSIDRFPNNDGNYEPGNCRWATQTEQANNRHSSHFLECDGERHTMSEWSRIVGVKVGTIRSRIYREGWSIKDALSTPTRPMNP